MRRAIALVFVAVILAVFAGAAWLAYGIFADRSRPAATAGVVIPRGATFADITKQLYDAGIIGNPQVFRLYAKVLHADTQARAGEFRFAPHQTEAAILHRLQTGGAQIAKWITIPEGYTAKQIAAQLQNEGFGEAQAYESAFMHDSITIDGFKTNTMEGYLFPDTYLMPLGASPRTVENIMSSQFRKELPADASRKAHALGFTVPQIVTIASLIEREAKADGERPLMAGVYYNRLRIGMPLEVDATIEYALPEHHTIVTYSDLRLDSPYNTYLHQGLPPTPIANPGQPSLVAALNPRPSQYLFYVYKGHGHHVFARTLSEQNANVAKYLK